MREELRSLYFTLVLGGLASGMIGLLNITQTWAPLALFAAVVMLLLVVTLLKQIGRAHV